MTPEYTAEDFSVTLAADDFINGFRDAPRFDACCRACPRYGTSWACPPFGNDLIGEVRRYRRVTVYATRITPSEKGLPQSMAWPLMRPERVRTEALLLSQEATTGGRAFAHAGICLHCPEGSCTRPKGMPCRHPQLVRPALEAVGFDIGKVAEHLFEMPLLWGTDGCLPDYLLLVTAIFHD